MPAFDDDENKKRSNRALEQLFSNLFPRDGVGRIRAMGFNAAMKLLFVGTGELKRVRRFCRDAVPNVFDELNALGNGQRLIIVYVCTHGYKV